MDILVVAVLEGELEAGSTDVAVGVEVGGDEGGGSDQHEASDIKFPAMKEVGGDIFLDDERPARVL